MGVCSLEYILDFMTQCGNEAESDKLGAVVTALLLGDYKITNIKNVQENRRFDLNLQLPNKTIGQIEYFNIHIKYKVKYGGRKSIFCIWGDHAVISVGGKRDLAKFGMFDEGGHVSETMEKMLELVANVG